MNTAKLIYLGAIALCLAVVAWIVEVCFWYLDGTGPYLSSLKEGVVR